MNSTKLPPLILLTPSTQKSGAEFADASVSSSNRYAQAVIRAGGLPCIMPVTDSAQVVEQLVEHCQGMMLTGGEDVEPKLYCEEPLPEVLARTVQRTEPERDQLELLLVQETFRQRKPMFCICRGQQMLNVALGGTLVVDIASQIPGALNHKQMEKKMEGVHEVALTPGSLMATITNEQTLQVNSTHHQAIGRVAEPLRVSGRSPLDGVIEAVELKDPSQLPFLLSVQFHPERLFDQNKAFLRLFRSFVEACAKARRTNL